jgi:DNA primase
VFAYVALVAVVLVLFAVGVALTAGRTMPGSQSRAVRKRHLRDSSDGNIDKSEQEDSEGASHEARQQQERAA